MKLSPQLIQKYNKPAPRYTSYPTVPLWENNISSEGWGNKVQEAFKLYGKSKGITLYIHLPFCESLCTYCGCNKRITKNHEVEIPYLNSILLEWKRYLELFSEKPKLAGIHLGGGTPTFFKPSSLSFFLQEILNSSEVMIDVEFSFEGHPNNTTLEHLEELNKLGFDRVSYGIQDFDMIVQQTIHRIQPFEKVQEATANARKTGYKSVNFDLIYGLPHQTLDTLYTTFQKVKRLRPDRIAFYSYAHLPSVFPAQKSYESFLPNDNQKRELYEFGKANLMKMGYREIGMDHFALPNDPLYTAKINDTLHRNFMGYTTSPSKILIGLGASSISDIHLAYAQNEKKIDTYQDFINNDSWAFQKGHLLSEKDIIVREIILDIICQHQAEIPLDIWESLNEKQIFNLKEMQWEGLISIDKRKLKVNSQGIAVIRQICMQFDLKLAESKTQRQLFSKAI